ncbi:MAG: CHAT domain-containing protein [Chromatiales bacterium]|nr:CHAT domain-containing protein [Chromatiales bacterium]
MRRFCLGLILSLVTVSVTAVPSKPELEALLQTAQAALQSTPATAWRALTQARDLAESLGDSNGQSRAAGLLAGIYLAQDRAAEAARLNDQAIFFAQESVDSNLLYRWHWQGAQIARQLDNIDQAILHYRDAARNVEQSGAATAQYREVLGPLYLQWADLLLQRAAAKTDPQADLREARAAVERLKTAELRDYFLDACVTAAQSRATEADAGLAATAVIYPVLLDDRTEILLSLPDGIRQHTVPVSSSQMRETAYAFRQLLEKRATNQYLRPARTLYDWLIRPLEADLQAANIRTLVLVPDGPLRTIPLAALNDGQSFLVERYALATTPGLTLTDASPLKRERPRILLNGLTESVQGFPALPAVERELDAIETLFDQPARRRLENGQFVLNNVESELSRRPYNVVHIASHGEFASDIRNSFLLTYRERMTMDRLEEYMQFRRYSDQPVELLTLSACQTAAGDDRSALGLAGVAIKAGARSALGTLWFVNDEASSQLITDFYRHLLEPGQTKASALQLAQRSLITDPRYRHPGYWSPFLLIGNWL